MNSARLLVDLLSPILSIPLSCPVDPAVSLFLSLSRFPKYRRLYLLRWIHILAPQLATRGWTRISVRWLYLGPVGADCDAVGRSTGVRGREQNRNARVRGTRGEKTRRRIEIRIDPRKSSGTRSTFGYSCDPSSLSFFSILLLCFFSFSSCAFLFLFLIESFLDFFLVCLAHQGFTFPWR